MTKNVLITRYTWEEKTIEDLVESVKQLGPSICFSPVDREAVEIYNDYNDYDVILMRVEFDCVEDASEFCCALEAAGVEVR